MIDVTEAIAMLPVDHEVTRVYYDPVNDLPKISVRAVVLKRQPVFTSQVMKLQVFDTVREATLCCELVGNYIRSVRRLTSSDS